jgi:hypothetical protein
MTLKEEAIELVDKYWNNIPDLFFEEAKECALIALDFAMNSKYSFQPMNGGWVSGKLYYEELKQEIEKL